ncbi:mCG144540, partial [Mus musculus]
KKHTDGCPADPCLHRPRDPSHLRSGAQKLAVEFVCRARAPTVSKESRRPPAQSSVPLSAPAVPSLPPRSRGDSERRRRRRRETPAAVSESL